MKNVKSEVEQKIQIKKEETINLKYKNKLELQNIKQNKNQIAKYKSKKELFLSYLFYFFFSFCTSTLYSFYEEGKRILYKGDAPQIKININKNGSFDDKKLLRNDSNYELKKLNMKTKIFKSNVKIIIYIIVVNSFTYLLSNNNINFSIESKFSNITLKI